MYRKIKSLLGSDQFTQLKYCWGRLDVGLYHTGRRYDTHVFQFDSLASNFFTIFLTVFDIKKARTFSPGFFYY